MPSKHLLLLIALTGLSGTLFSQHVDKGQYNGWNYGPHGVYGNLPLTKTAERKYYTIEKKDDTTVVVRQFNPSGISINTTTITFVNGLLSRVEEANQWGDTSDYRKFTSQGKNEFIVTNLRWGVNNFLPCKYAKYIYNKELLTEIQYYSFADSLAENEDGCAIVRYQRYDDKIRFAEIKETSWFDAQNHPVISKTAECHTLVNEYDDHDNKLSESYRDINNQPVAIHTGRQAGRQFTYDEQNRLVKSEYHGLDGGITQNATGIAMEETEYSHGYPSKETRFDARHVVCRTSPAGDSIAIIKYEYDSNGNKIREAYYDEGEIPIIDHTGVHKILNSYSADMLVQTSFVDDLQNPSMNRDGIHTIRYGRDSIGRLIEESTYDVEGVPTRNFSDKVYMRQFKYDKYGRRISVSYWKDSVTMMPRWSGSFAETTNYDEHGRAVEYRYLDQFGEPFTGAEGSSMSRLVYKADGKLGMRQYLDHDTLTSKRKGVTRGYSILRYSHDEHGRVKELTFFDVNDQPVNAIINFAAPFPAQRIVFIYKGSRIVQQFYYQIGNDLPFRIVDCLKNDYIATSGINTGRRNLY